jgi:hypothetical protein
MIAQLPSLVKEEVPDMKKNVKSLNCRWLIGNCRWLIGLIKSAVRRVLCTSRAPATEAGSLQQLQQQFAMLHHHAVIAASSCCALCSNYAPRLLALSSPRCCAMTPCIIEAVLLCLVQQLRA